MKREVILKPTGFSKTAGYLCLDGIPESLRLNNYELDILLRIAGYTQYPQYDKEDKPFEKPIKLTITVEEI